MAASLCYSNYSSDGASKGTAAMPKTTAKKAKPSPTREPTVTPTDGEPAWLVSCDCATHPVGMTKAIVRSSGSPVPSNRIHGHVTLAHSPAGRLMVRMSRPTVWPVH